MLKSFPIFKRNGAILVEKMMFEKNKNRPLSKLECFDMQKHFWFVSNFEHVDFAINGKYAKFFYDNPNYYDSFMIFQTYKMVVLKSVHSLGWLLWLWFSLILILIFIISPRKVGHFKKIVGSKFWIIIFCWFLFVSSNLHFKENSK